ncbi:predicted protein [Nematostella vectensis]|uniref:Cytochrome P450 n=1 Tax=Nematostella vectensis TaxID=45351 RepID=A7SX55_NEMVE|nr:predicted protein [Nematostella vectensis]|eukprot:XP_001623815.1 predicted protein [Nematostella vectensis]
MSSLPGHIGWPVTGDKTIEFSKNPTQFVKGRITEYESRIFQTRILNKPHVFVASSQGVKEVLQDHSYAFTMGYKDFGYMYSLYGDLLLFNDSDEATRLKRILCSVLQPHQMAQCLAEVDTICSRVLVNLHTEPVSLYKTFKTVTTQICLTLFLGLDFEEAQTEAGQIVDLTIQHWNGLISLPVYFNVYGQKSGYSKAMLAKNRLLEVINKQLLEVADLDGTIIGTLKEAGFVSRSELANHLLLFVSALVPKALASLLTSFCLELAKPRNNGMQERAAKDDLFLDDALLEVQRLWPPFLGGRRIARQDVVIDGYRIPSGYHVAYLTKASNTDPSIFPGPNHFDPKRWRTRVVGLVGLIPSFVGGQYFFCFSSQFVMRYLLRYYKWSLPEDQDLTYKWLPVSRPKHDVQVAFTKKTADFL